MPKNQMIFPEFWVFYQNITVNPRSYYLTIEYCEMFMVVHFYLVRRFVYMINAYNNYVCVDNNSS